MGPLPSLDLPSVSLRVIRLIALAVSIQRCAWGGSVSRRAGRESSECHHESTVGAPLGAPQWKSSRVDRYFE